MFNLDDITNESNKEHNENRPFIPEHPYRFLQIRGSRSGKTNVLLNLIKERGDIDKMNFYARDLSKPKYEFSMKECEDAGIKHLEDCIY